MAAPRFSDHHACCGVTKAKDEGCSVRLDLGQEVECLSGTRYQEQHERDIELADFMVRARRGDDVRLAAIECKSKNPRISKVKNQLQTAADVAGALTTEDPDVTFRAVLASMALPTVAFAELKKSKVRFRGKDHPIRRIRCGSALSSVY